MMESIETGVNNVRAVVSMQFQLSDWLREHALPVWDRHGVDRAGGGFFENLGVAAASIVALDGAARRGRVVARQIYVFDVARRMGWRSAAVNPVIHGCDYLLQRLYGGHGMFHAGVDTATQQPLAAFSLYEHAFYLFALARLHTTEGCPPVEETATLCLQRLRLRFGKNLGGFEESTPPVLPLRSNPHMHLLEAALEWIDAAAGARRLVWVDLGRELVRLCLTRFRDVSTGAIREHFDFRWERMPDDTGRVLEPGHQFEWAWLLVRWARTEHATATERTECAHAARRLIDIGESRGVDPERGVVLNEIWDDMTWKDAAAKLWPQTERLKAWCAAFDMAATDAEAERACHHITVAARGLARYLREDVPGLWHELQCFDGEFSIGPSKASSLYHIVCAIDVLRQTAADPRMTARLAADEAQRA